MPAAGVEPAPEYHLNDDTLLVDRDEPEVLGPTTVRAIDLTAAAVTLALLVVVALSLTGPPRVVLALTFVTFVPGWAVLGHTRVGEGVSKIALAVAASLTICTATALAMAWLRSWHPFALFYALGGASLVLVLSSSPRRTAPAPAPAPPPAPAPAPPPAPVPPLDRPAVLAPAADPVPPAPSTPAVMPSPPEPRRHIVQPENPRLSRVAVHIVFPTRSPFTANELSGFFAAISDRHPFADFHRDTDAGAVMETKGSRRLEVRRDSIDYSEGGAVDFGLMKDNTLDLLIEVQGRLGVQVLANPSCHLEARWLPDVDGESSSRLFAPAAGVDLHQQRFLSSSGSVGVGLRFTGESEEPRHNWQVTMEPDGAAGHVALDVVSDSCLPADGPDAVGEHLEHAHHFLTENVVRFVESLAEPPTDEH